MILLRTSDLWLFLLAQLFIMFTERENRNKSYLKEIKSPLRWVFSRATS